MVSIGSRWMGVRCSRPCVSIKGQLRAYAGNTRTILAFLARLWDQLLIPHLMRQVLIIVRGLSTDCQQRASPSCHGVQRNGCERTVVVSSADSSAAPGGSSPRVPNRAASTSLLNSTVLWPTEM
jgi:hypothetical protein